jgi:sterol desaturase/sphingolipid hydroxylase (fatty acid hydroxylase superfamily)
MNKYQILKIITQLLFYVQPFVDRSYILIFLRDLCGTHCSNKFFYISLTLGINFLTRFIVDIFFLSLYYFQPKFLENYKINKKWLWETDINYNNKIFGTIMHYLSLNVFIFVPLALISFDENNDYHKIDPILVPKWYVSFYQIMVTLLLYDLIFFIIHKSLHSKYLYWIHKKHHEYTNTVIWADTHTSFIEVLLVAVFPYIIIGMLFDTHVYTQCMLIIVSITLGISQHSNYDLPYSPFDLIPFSNTNKAHVYHHKLLNVNFAPYWTTLDTIFGSNKIHKK